MTDAFIKKSEIAELVAAQDAVFKKQNVKMKFNEEDFLNEVIEYMRATYAEHYANNDGDQTIEYVQALDDKNTLIFLKGNAIKYISRYGKKAGHNKKDLLKAIHYICFMDYFAQKEENKENE